MLDDVTLVILTDGKTTHLDKPTALQSMVKDLGSAFASVIVCTSHSSMCDGLGEAVVFERSVSPPLRAIHAALGRSLTQWNFCVGLDMPFVTSEVARTLRAHADDVLGAQVVLPLLSTGLQPRVAMYSRSCRHIMGRALQCGQRRIVAALADLRLSIVGEKEFSACSAFTTSLVAQPRSQELLTESL